MGEARRRYFARNGIARETLFDNDRPEGFVIKTSQDVEPVLDSIARDRELFTHTGPNRVLGRLPAIIVEDLIRRGLYFDLDAFDKWWNSYEADPWRIWKGSV
jgi:hypothetical protein